MGFPGSDTCATCHADKSEMERTRNAILVTGASPPAKPENRELHLPGKP